MVITPLPYFLAVLAVLATTRVQAQPAPQLLQINTSSKARRELVLAPIRRKPVTTPITATAIIEPNAGAIAEVTSEIPARVFEIVAQLGEKVKPGEPLVIMSSVDLGQAKTEYLKARSLESITNQHLRLEQDLYAKKITPMKDLLEARGQHDAALAEYKAAREKLRSLIPASQIRKLQWSENGQPLSEFSLSSPIAGTLVKRDLAIGAMIGRSSPAPLMIVNLERVWVIANVFEHDIANLKTGDQANVTVDAYSDRLFSGQITYISDEGRPRYPRHPNTNRSTKPASFVEAGNVREGHDYGRHCAPGNRCPGICHLPD